MQPHLRRHLEPQLYVSQGATPVMRPREYLFASGRLVKGWSGVWVGKECPHPMENPKALEEWRRRLWVAGVDLFFLLGNTQLRAHNQSDLCAWTVMVGQDIKKFQKLFCYLSVSHSVWLIPHRHRGRRSLKDGDTIHNTSNSMIMPCLFQIVKHSKKQSRASH